MDALLFSNVALSDIGSFFSKMCGSLLLAGLVLISAFAFYLFASLSYLSFFFNLLPFVDGSGTLFDNILFC